MKKNGIKWALNFDKKVTFEEGSTSEFTEDYYTGASILALNGATWHEFGSDEKAMEAVQHLVQQNEETFDTDLEEHPHIVDPKMPQFSKYWYIASKGKTTSIGSKETKELRGTSSVKNAKQLQDAHVMMEALPSSFSGDGAEGQKDGKIVSVKFEELQKENVAFQKTYFILRLP